MIAARHDLTCDGYLGGRLQLWQPKSGHRAGLDAALLASACSARNGERVADFGAGVGTAGLSVLARLRENHACDAQLVLLERDETLVDLCTRNIAENKFAAQASAVRADLSGPARPVDLGLAAGSFDHVIANPPFNDPHRGQTSDRQAAYELATDELETWFRWAAALLRNGGTLTIIHRPADIAGLLRGLEGRFGGASVYPIYPRAGADASRIIVQCVRGSRATTKLSPGLTLHGADNAYLPAADAILRSGASWVKAVGTQWA